MDDTRTDNTAALVERLRHPWGGFDRPEYRLSLHAAAEKAADLIEAQASTIVALERQGACLQTALNEQSERGQDREATILDLTRELASLRLEIERKDAALHDLLKLCIARAKRGGFTDETIEAWGEVIAARAALSAGDYRNVKAEMIEKLEIAAAALVGQSMPVAASYVREAIAVLSAGGHDKN